MCAIGGEKALSAASPGPRFARFRRHLTRDSCRAAGAAAAARRPACPNAPWTLLPSVHPAAPPCQVTLVFSAKDKQHNNAVALKQYLERHARQAQRGDAVAGGGRGSKRKGEGEPAREAALGGAGKGRSKRQKAGGGGRRRAKTEE